MNDQTNPPTTREQGRSSPTTGEINKFALTMSLAIAAEVKRLANLGVRIEVDDARQDAVMMLIEELSAMPAIPDQRLAQAIVRRRLSNKYIREPMKRINVAPYGQRSRARASATQVHLTTIPSADIDSNGLGVDEGVVQTDDDVSALSVPSHEREVVDRVSAEEVADMFPPLRGKSRQARHQHETKWLPRVRRFVNGKETAA